MLTPLEAAPAAVGAAAGAAARAARGTVHGADSVWGSARRVGHVARNAVRGGAEWRAERRVHLPLRPAADRPAPEGGTAALARKVAAALEQHPEVITAYWDGGLSRLVVTVAEDEVTDGVERKAAGLAARFGLEPAVDDSVEEFAHPGDPRGVRDAAAALAFDVAGTAGALTGWMLRLPRSPRVVTAAVTLLRENPRLREVLRERLGPTGTDLALAAANAAAHGAGQSPVALVLDGVLRAGQLTEAVARAALFESLHDDFCATGRDSVTCVPASRPERRVTPAQEYAATSAAGSLAGAAATLLLRHNAEEAAEAVLAGSPKAARYGPAAFNAALGTLLARAGILVRDSERMRQLELADTLVLHSGALRRPGEECLDARVEGVLHAARDAGLYVVMTDDPALGDTATLADEVAPPGRSFGDIVRTLRDDDRVVVTVARIPSSGAAPGTEPAGGTARAGTPYATSGGSTATPHGTGDDCVRELDAAAAGVLDGLLAGDVAVACVDRESAVVWGADLLVRNGLADVWRVLTAIPAARQAGRRSQALARAGAALSGLLVASGGGAQVSWRRLPGSRHAPVNIAATAALLFGWRAALTAALACPPRPRPRVAWHELDSAEVRERLRRAGAQEEGGHAARAATRERERARAVARTPALAPVRWTVQAADAIRRELDDPLTPVLATGAAASALLGSVVDALLVLGAMDLNATAGGLQRLRAERALAGLAAGQKAKAHKVKKGARPVTVDAARLKPGDEIRLAAGDVVPADARLVAADGLEVDESALTGESLPVAKDPAPTPDASLAQRCCMVFEGTTVVAGEATALVVGTGEQTEAGRAVSLAARTPPPAGVQARLQELTRKALPVTLAGGAAVTGLSLLRGSPVRQAVSGGVAVAVAAVPEGLPLVATVAQMAAARRLSRHGVLVRSPRTLEALGRVDTVCFDKTGTLTENRLRLVRLVMADGTALTPDAEGAADPLRLAARACPQPGNAHRGRPAHATDEAVLDVAPADDWTPVAELPFEASRGYAAAVGHAGDGEHLLVLKGAPEVVLPACRDVPDRVSETVRSLAGEGLRVLALARRPVGADAAGTVLDEAPDGLELVGLLALADAPRDTSAALLAGLRRAGVVPVMLTGDHPQTAHAIAVQLGWPESTQVVTGDELLAMDRAARTRALRDAGVIARVAPEQKLQVVESLQEAGRVVAMTGDGANDAAAIRAADVGVGIAARGSAAARNAADIVLTRSDLSVLVDAVAEARALWRSVADAVSILIGGNAGEVGFSVLGTLLSGSSPLSTRQLLLVNLLTDMFPAMAVAVTPSDDPATGEHVDTAPMDTGLLGAPLLRNIRRRGVTTCLGAVTAYLFGRFTPGTERRSSTMALCGVVGAQLVQTLMGRRHSPLVWATALGSAAVLAALVQTPGVSHFFGCTPLGPLAWAGVALSITLSALAPRLERLKPVRQAYDAATRAALRLDRAVRKGQDWVHSGVASPAA
ncbi:cation-translocating P-type ATPase [Streptomyces longispororuber]|uniref:cation-translocating P-type ATPase n=1 Tax=Streptomyces longispororuber TaxID=68230 RepID=UPI00167C9825|nr:cation-translocating P-type ATPase [Streptomyces longispororuber]